MRCVCVFKYSATPWHSVITSCVRVDIEFFSHPHICKQRVHLTIVLEVISKANSQKRASPHQKALTHEQKSNLQASQSLSAQAAIDLMSESALRDRALYDRAIHTLLSTSSRDFALCLSFIYKKIDIPVLAIQSLFLVPFLTSNVALCGAVSRRQHCHTHVAGEGSNSIAPAGRHSKEHAGDACMNSRAVWVHAPHISKARRQPQRMRIYMQLHAYARTNHCIFFDRERMSVCARHTYESHVQ